MVFAFHWVRKNSVLCRARVSKIARLAMAVLLTDARLVLEVAAPRWLLTLDSCRERWQVLPMEVVCCSIHTLKRFKQTLQPLLPRHRPRQPATPCRSRLRFLSKGLSLRRLTLAEQLIGPDSDRQTPASQSRFTIADAYGSIEVYLDVGGLAQHPTFRFRQAWWFLYWLPS